VGKLQDITDFGSLLTKLTVATFIEIEEVSIADLRELPTIQTSSRPIVACVKDEVKFGGDSSSHHVRLSDLKGKVLITSIFTGSVLKGIVATKQQNKDMSLLVICDLATLAFLGKVKPNNFLNNLRNELSMKIGPNSVRTGMVSKDNKTYTNSKVRTVANALTTVKNRLTDSKLSEAVQPIFRNFIEDLVDAQTLIINGPRFLASLAQAILDDG
jgi:hypothetical protein